MMAETNKLVPVAQREVEFYGDTLTAIRAEDGQIYVSIRNMCQSLGLDDNGQRQRIRRHIVLADGLMVCNLHTIQGERETYVLRIDMVPLWLSGIRVTAVKDEIRPKLTHFQREAAKVLWEAFQEGRLTADPDLDELLQQDTDAVQAYKMLQALVKLARNQILLEARQDVQQALLSNHEQRLETIEAALSNPDRYISREQASRISQAVRAIGHVLSERNGRSEYGAIYGELYRNFEISAYRELPAQKYEEAMKWLNAWYQRLTNRDIPF
ncbi:MAG TPA: phage antirepressor N-terminal domain-containing protein [Chloroflexota bacterium]|nr:phage antirepressor N-terminal domain-containing protein [Chloroflexota bacterium]HUM71304.1 phage antirepressor N-terminal domain-containing protein [Chloroflexota bacterium]